MAFGDGSFSKRDGGFRYYVQYKSDIDDKVYRLSVTGRTKTECREKMKEKIREKKQEVSMNFRHSLDNRTVVLKDALMDWLKKEKTGKVKASTKSFRLHHS